MRTLLTSATIHPMRSYEKDVDSALSLIWSVVEDLDRSYGRSQVWNPAVESMALLTRALKTSGEVFRVSARV